MITFIESGNRIVTENFVIGEIYTIAFTNGNYKTMCCIGVGSDFVMFQYKLPNALFCLTLGTAETVSSIEIGGGGSGTMNYNELENQPQINGIVLIGNKTAAELGLLSQADLDNYVTDTELTTELASKQDALTTPQLTAVNSGITSSLVTQIGTNTTTISGKQDQLTTPQLTAVNSGITSSDVTQITTNKNNILIVEKNLSAKNHLNSEYADTQTGSPINGVTYTKQTDGSYKATGTPTATSRLILTEANPAVGYLDITPYNGMMFTCLTATGSGTTFATDIIYYNDSNVYVNEQHDYGNGVIIAIPDTATKAVIRISIYTGAGQDINLTFKPMICDKTLWDAGYTDFKPYEPTNAELWAMIKALQ